MLLERERVGQGWSGRSAGLMTPEPGPSFRDVRAAHGVKTARRVFDTWRRGALDGAALLRRLNVKCQLTPRETLVVAGRDDEERTLRREFEARGEAGLDVSWQNRKQVKARMQLDAAGGIKLRDGFTLDPYRACLGL